MSPLNPKVISLLLAVLISAITSGFLWFVPGTPGGTIFIAGATSFFATLILVFYVLDYLIFEEINKIYDTIQRLKLSDFSFSKKKVAKSVNPLKKLNNDIFVYVAKKQREIDELRRMEQFRREFLADVSHELKTPIFAAQGFIHTLIDGAKDDERVRDKFLQKAAKSLDGLDVLVADLLTLSQIEAGEIKMHRERVDVIKVTQEVIEQLEPRANQRNIKVKLHTFHNQIFVKADAYRISQALTNLIDNAIKYGRDGGKVDVTFTEDKKDWTIEVKDDGPGIPPEHLNRIFERFYRVEKSRSKEKGGTGLGLAIVKHIVNAHKSKITVMSRVDKGTTFSFKLDKIDEKMAYSLQL
ncbi:MULTISPECIES: cell wall metabolism sensor histidine kinase WalK [unclassified Siphonobacter]|uniref:sensor histidine kinase n=1 Tax=unclassified Siphonobacter TaxID=2635712 RepID=UPI000CC3F8E3|nr:MULTISPECIES: ATP-binding protein [unclassified Siphonobacter]MDQ1086100.1 two-component system phosphate regulon sensor histidine kinase PhoR [Siphonobacter sp. SORGH_AS_1065]MDR6196421.1 two-component system phosphate regulon sensor histidine kinase PhoR [Siphonobacter sp. SORGH_AS_0500]PKK35241.1 two-component sensor histidine kinase [Siphonobacter sp. SORGH_AS_0500]